MPMRDHRILPWSGGWFLLGAWEYGLGDLPTPINSCGWIFQSLKVTVGQVVLVVLSQGLGPQKIEIFGGEVFENSKSGTTVGHVVASDLMRFLSPILLPVEWGYPQSFLFHR